MPPNTDEEIKQRLRTIFPDAATAKRVIDIVVTKKPNGWSSKSQAPYYKEYFGLQMQKYADDMLRDKKDIAFRYDIYCGVDREIMSEQTLYNRINQSKRYLLDFLDDHNKKYSTWDAITNVSREVGVGVVIRFKTEFHDFLDGIGPTASPDSILPVKDEPLWKRKMDTWLEGESVAPFMQDGLALTKEQADKLQGELDCLGGIEASVTCMAIKIVRVNE